MNSRICWESGSPLDYTSLKLLHLALAGISVAGFIWRWALMMQGSALVETALTRVLPHVIDTLFLVSGVWLAFMLSLNPLQQPWLAAKLIGLVAYIVLASIAYKRARTPGGKTLFFVLALLVFVWMASVARFKDPLGVIALAVNGIPA